LSRNVVIVESPAKAKTIEKYLGKDFKVLASFGHIRDLPSKDGSVDPDNDFALNYVVPKESQKHIKAIADAVKQADTIYLATDLDREGEAISWHVLDELEKRLKGLVGKEVKRIEFTEITKSAIQNAVANPRTLAMPLVDAQQARRALDYLVGFTLSPVLWRKVRSGLSAGRVQSVALRLICEREDEIEAFVAQEYWSIQGLFNASGTELPGKLWQYAGEKVEKFTFTNEEETTKAVTTLQQQTYSVSALEQKNTNRRPAPPFITSTLQQEASRKLGFGARRTMQAAQRLYEAGYITYMRTDSLSLSQDALNGLRRTIGNMFGDKYLPAKPNFYKSKSKNAQEAHEAIRPSDAGLTSDALNVDEDDQRRLYDLIWKRAIACQMAPATLKQTAITLSSADKQHAFRATGSVVVFDGFMKVYMEDAGEKDTILPAVEEGQELPLISVDGSQHFTEPPARYSEASLVKALEENGIGRPSTYAAIVSTIRDRGYVRLEQRRFYPEDVGRIVNKFLTEHFPKYVDLNFTAEMEEELDEIARGEREWKPMLREFWSPFKTLVDEKIQSVKKSDVTTERTGRTCPTCNKGELVIRLGRHGRFIGCDNYPECKHTEPLEGTAEADADKPQPQLEDTGVTCPKCKEGSLVERKSRRGKTFYSCSTYPKCDYAVWDKPIETPCPECNHPITTVRERKTGDVTKCPNCNWQDPPMTEAEKKRAEAAKERWAKRKKTTKTTRKKSA
jgi:DNA topoisomerase-1